jgi:ribosomal protein S18 acetylase RimI-like enzyme
MIEIRKGELKDLAVLVEFIKGCALESENTQLDPATVERGVRAVLERPNRGTYYIAEIEGQAAGCLMTNTQWIDWKATANVYIQSVYTKPEYRGRGVFKALYYHVLNEAKGKYLSVRLYADNLNQRALDVYTGLGMTIPDYQFLEVDFAFS